MLLGNDPGIATVEERVQIAFTVARHGSVLLFGYGPVIRWLVYCP